MKKGAYMHAGEAGCGWELFCSRVGRVELVIGFLFLHHDFSSLVMMHLDPGGLVTVSGVVDIVVAWWQLARRLRRINGRPLPSWKPCFVHFGLKWDIFSPANTRELTAHNNLYLQGPGEKWFFVLTDEEIIERYFSLSYFVVWASFLCWVVFYWFIYSPTHSINISPVDILCQGAGCVVLNKTKYFCPYEAYNII